AGGVRCGLARGLALQNTGALVRARPLGGASQEFVGAVGLPANEPLGIGELPLERLPPRLEPAELLGLSLPEAKRVALGLGVNRGALDARRLREGLRRRKLSPFLQEGLDGLATAAGFRHGAPRVAESLARGSRAGAGPGREGILPDPGPARGPSRRPGSPGRCGPLPSPVLDSAAAGGPVRWTWI